MALSARIVPAAPHVHDELYDAWHFLGPSADTTQLPRSFGSESLVDSHCVLVLCPITPFSTSLLAEFPAYRIALVFYWLNILLLGTALYFSWVRAIRTALVKDDMPPDVTAAIKRRIVIGQSLYAFGALLCIFNTYWSITFIVLVQLNYAIAPRIRRAIPR